MKGNEKKIEVRSLCVCFCWVGVVFGGGRGGFVFDIRKFELELYVYVKGGFEVD